MKESFSQSAIIELEEKKAESPAERSGLFTLTQRNEDFTNSNVDNKDFTVNLKPKYKPKSRAMKTLHTFRGEG